MQIEGFDINYRLQLKESIDGSALRIMIRIYTQQRRGQQWLQHHQHCCPRFVCILGFTETGLIEGISAAGATPADRQYTAIADAEFLVNGVQPHPKYPLPPLQCGASPVFISRTAIEALKIPVDLINAGLPHPLPVPAIDLKGRPARCITTGQALPLETVKHLFEEGLAWGEALIARQPNTYLILGECVVGGTTTALSVLTGLGVDALGKVNSSHPHCNHSQKWSVVQEGLTEAGLLPILEEVDPFVLITAVGDPMQIVAAGMTIAASRKGGVLLAGGTQMLAVYALVRAISRRYHLFWEPDRVAVGTTRWVAEDATGDTVGLGNTIGEVPLLGTTLSFATSRYSNLRAYEQGYVKEGVGAGGCAIATHLHQGWTGMQLLVAIETLVAQLSEPYSP
nr:TIGR00303 family protein [Lusitaniella coriacea]